MLPDGQPEVRSGSEVAKRLKGDIPCVQCGYNLRQLSVLEVCPECGTPVRATVLAVVDPYASVLQPVRFRRLVAAGLVVWAGGAVLAALLTWAVRAGDVYAVLAGVEVRMVRWSQCGAALIVMSSLGAAALVRPHAKIPVWQSVCAVCGVVGGLTAAYLYWELQVRHDPLHVRPFVESIVVQPHRAWMRMEIAAVMAAGLLLLRPAARMLSARSLLLRMGRVDRQRIFALVMALGLASAGDLARLAAQELTEPWMTALNTIGIVTIAVGSMLLTVGLIGTLVDCVRIARVIVKPAAALSDVVGPGGDE